MRTEHLEEFLDLTETLNFTKTAKNFYTSQPVLTKHIADLERSLGGVLFLRDQRHVELTAFGRDMIPYAHDVVSSTKRLEDVASCYFQQDRKSLTVSFLYGAVGHLVARVHHRFKEIYPHIDVLYRTIDFFESTDALEGDDTDIGIFSLESAFEGRPGKEYAYNVLFEDDIAAVTHSSHVWAKEGRHSVRVGDLEGQTILIAADSTDNPTSRHFKALLEESGVSADIVARYHNLDEVPFLLDAERCITVLPEHTCAYFEGRNADIAFFPFEDISERSTVSIIWRKHDKSAVVRDYVRLFREAYGEFGEGAVGEDG